MSQRKADASQTEVTTVDLLRHGACEGGEIFRGITDSMLLDEAWLQMESAVPLSEDYQAVVSSPLRRCNDFSRRFSVDRGLPLSVDSKFSEISFGDWEGQLVADVAKAHPQRIEKFWKNPAECPPPEGEPLADFQERVVLAWKELLQSQRGGQTLLVSHGGVIRLILAEVLQMPLRPLSFIAVPQACYSRIQVFHQPGQDDWPQLVFHNRSMESSV